MRATPRLPRGLSWSGWSVWLLGAGLSIAAAASNDTASAVLTAAIFAVFVPWLVLAGRRLG
jgi:hypothetical protein